MPWIGRSDYDRHLIGWVRNCRGPQCLAQFPARRGTSAHRARRIEAGQVTINGFGSRGVIGAPWGGYKHSGFGRTMSADSVLDYTQVKTVVINA
ncbi:MAG: aldehyde dehydrogenase family protein [Solirubrobacteraceae bacterium]